MLSRSVADQVGAAKEAPRSHAYRWSSDKQPRTRPSGGSWCYEGWSAPSPKLGADIRCIASVSVSPIHKHFGCRSEDTQTHPATGRRPGIFGKPLRWRTATEIRARFSETSGEAPLQSTACGVLKQPDKQELARAYRHKLGRYAPFSAETSPYSTVILRGLTLSAFGSVKVKTP